MLKELARQKAAQAWTMPETSSILMDTRLAQAFASIIEEVSSQPWLGNATTGELLDELRARCEMNGTLSYRTVD